jgi:peptide deformylase
MQTLSEIRQLGDAILRRESHFIENVLSDEVKMLTEQMLFTLAHSKGVGLAAPQIGHSVQAIVVASKPTVRYPNAPQMEPIIMFNPQFQALSNEKVKDWEGCLSIPGIRAQVPRYTHIRINYTDTAGMPCTVEWHDFIARIFQHEYDHLHGKVYLDNVEKNSDIISETEFFKLITA